MPPSRSTARLLHGCVVLPSRFRCSRVAGLRACTLLGVAARFGCVVPQSWALRLFGGRYLCFVLARWCKLPRGPAVVLAVPTLRSGLRHVGL